MLNHFWKLYSKGFYKKALQIIGGGGEFGLMAHISGCLWILLYPLIFLCQTSVFVFIFVISVYFYTVPFLFISFVMCWLVHYWISFFWLQTILTLVCVIDIVYRDTKALILRFLRRQRQPPGETEALINADRVSFSD